MPRVGLADLPGRLAERIAVGAAIPPLAVRAGLIGVGVGTGIAAAIGIAVVVVLVKMERDVAAWAVVPAIPVVCRRRGTGQGDHRNSRRAEDQAFHGVLLCPDGRKHGRGRTGATARR